LAYTYLLGREFETIPNDDRQECAEAVKNGNDRDLDDAMDPALDILGCFLNICFAVMARSLRVGVCLCSVCTLTHQRLLFFVEEVGCLEILGNEKDTTRRP
jgi:hypothetical protein